MSGLPVRIRPDIARTPPYRQGAQAEAGAFKLSSNENTDAVATAVAEDGLVVRPYGADGVRITIGEEASIERVRASAASTLRLLPDQHAGRTRRVTSTTQGSAA